MSWAPEPGEQAEFRRQPPNTGVRAKGPCLPLWGVERRWGHFQCPVCTWQRFWKEHIPHCGVIFSFCCLSFPSAYELLHGKNEFIEFFLLPQFRNVYWMTDEWMKSQRIATFWGQMKDRRKGTPRELFTVLPHHFLPPHPPPIHSPAIASVKHKVKNKSPFWRGNKKLWCKKKKWFWRKIMICLFCLFI